MAIYILGPDQDGNCCTCEERVNVCDMCGGGECVNDYIPFCQLGGRTAYDFLIWVGGNGTLSASASGGPNLITVNGSSSNGAEAAIITMTAAINAQAGTVLDVFLNAFPGLIVDYLGMNVTVRDSDCNVVSSVSTMDTSHHFFIALPSAGKYYVEVGAACGPPTPPNSIGLAGGISNFTGGFDPCPIP